VLSIKKGVIFNHSLNVLYPAGLLFSSHHRLSAVLILVQFWP